MKKYKLIEKKRYCFTYTKEIKEPEYEYTAGIEIQWKNTWNGSYKGIQVICYQRGLNSEGFNNAVGMRNEELLRLPFMILHFLMYRLVHFADKTGTKK